MISKIRRFKKKANMNVRQFFAFKRLCEECGMVMGGGGVYLNLPTVEKEWRDCLFSFDHRLTFGWEKRYISSHYKSQGNAYHELWTCFIFCCRLVLLYQRWNKWLIWISRQLFGAYTVNIMHNKGMYIFHESYCNTHIIITIPKYTHQSSP